METDLPAVLAALTTTTTRGPLGGKSLFLRLGPEKSAIFKLSQNSRVLYRGPEPVN